MASDPVLDALNDAQREAVTAPLEPLLVLAGAGSGKTRVLVHRVAWLIREHHASPRGVLAVTFTNKAAAEMRGRIEELLGVPAGVLWVGTFHGIAHRLLRTHCEEAGLPKTFQIIDSDDQLRLIRRVIRGMNLDETQWAPREVRWFVNAQKTDGLKPDQVDDRRDPARKQMAQIYAVYEEACERSGLVDFGELLLRAHRLWLDNPALLATYQERFRFPLVDEFQDTNAIQYAWLRLLAGDTGKPFVVGDDDQSIYSWRGACVENLRRFQKDFKNARVIRLEQNYRSTGTILKAANALIAHNEARLGKNLWTDGIEGEPVHVYAAFNERDEADFILNRIRDWVASGNLRREVAILYRSNAQSRVFEEAFMNAGVPYRVYGGLRFFERAEIKDALAYLRLTSNRDDDSSFERVVNLPTRGIGARSVEALREYARANATSMWRAAGALTIDGLNARAANAVTRFLQLIERMAHDTKGLELYEQVDVVIKQSGLIEHHGKEKGERGAARIENLEELVNAAAAYELDDETGLSPLDSFLAHAALEAGEGQADAWEDCVQLMTMHSAKGLEFPVVFVAGMEEGLFPHQRSIDSLAGLEEERRLCYVSATRAMQQLYFLYAEQRRLHGQETYALPSRFITEIPGELVEEIRPRLKVSRPLISSRFANETPSPVKLGQRVRHRKFGDGVVFDLEGHGNNIRVMVNFEGSGRKELILAQANLELL